MRRRFASDLLNLTLAAPKVNRCGGSGKCARDAAEWLPPRNRCWFAQRVVEVRREYRLAIDRREADALERVLSGCESTEMVFHGDGAGGAAVSAGSSVSQGGPASRRRERARPLGRQSQRTYLLQGSETAPHRAGAARPSGPTPSCATVTATGWSANAGSGPAATPGSLDSVSNTGVFAHGHGETCDRAVQTLCRDCGHRPPPDAGTCPACNSPRVPRHGELHDLAIAHVDCDAFYAAIEKRDHPELRDVPGDRRRPPPGRGRRLLLPRAHLRRALRHADVPGPQGLPRRRARQARHEQIRRRGP